MERKELERVEGASSQPGLNFFVRNSTWAFHRYGALPQPLDDIQLEFVGRAREKTSDVKELLVPDCIEKSGLVYKERKMLTCYIAITRVRRSIRQFVHRNRERRTPGRSIRVLLSE
jgi:hypothetical protein